MHIHWELIQTAFEGKHKLWGQVMSWKQNQDSPVM